MTSCEEHFKNAGVLYPLEGGGFGEYVCHPKWLSYWMHCRMPTKTIWGHTFDAYASAFWKEVGKLIKLANCPCTPDCEGEACGPDGCGGSCGHCLSRWDECVDGQCVCTPECEDRECGPPDGCGGSCGICPRGDECIDGQCVCVPDCDGKECGNDGCGGDCGGCYLPEVCMPSGECCDPTCVSGKHACGDDGCGGSCGECPDIEVCQDGLCVCVLPSDCSAIVEVLDSQEIEPSLDELKEGARCLGKVFARITDRLFGGDGTAWQDDNDLHSATYDFLHDPSEGIYHLKLFEINTDDSLNNDSNCAAVVMGPSLRGAFVDPQDGKTKMYVRLYYLFESSSWVPSWLVEPETGEVWTLLLAQDVDVEVSDPGLQSCLEAYGSLGKALGDNEHAWPKKPGYDLWFLYHWRSNAGHGYFSFGEPYVSLSTISHQVLGRLYRTRES